jgi:hypothetical protein
MSITDHVIIWCSFVCQKVKDLEGQIQSLSGNTTPHSDDSQADKLPPVDPATVTNLVSISKIHPEQVAQL